MSLVGMSQTTVEELLSYIPEELLHTLAEELQADKWVKKLPASFLFKLLLFHVLESKELSLRSMASTQHSPVFLHLAETEVVASLAGWTGLRDRLQKVPVAYFQRIHAHVQQQIAQQTQRGNLYSVKRYDSTLMAVKGHLLQGIRVGNTTQNTYQVKLSTEYTNNYQISFAFHQEQKYLSEETALKELIEKAQHQADEIVVFDSGLKNRDTFDQFDQGGIQFITRLKRQPRYEVLYPAHQATANVQTERIDFLQDSIVRLYKNGHQRCEPHYRLIEYKVKDSQETIYLLTNIEEVPAEVIADIYARRWDIEILFRFLKQEMDLNHFLSYDENAIHVLLYCKCIAAGLILIYKQQNGISSFRQAKKDFFQELTMLILLEVMESVPLRTKFQQRARQYIQKE